MDAGHGNVATPDMSTPQAPYRFNNEELRVLRQCNKESFYQRSMPLSTLLSIGTFYAVKTGYFKGHPRFGATPKVLIAATVGYFMGKFSYQTKCAEKLMQLPNSPIGEMLRQRRRQGGIQETSADPSSLSWAEMESTPIGSRLRDDDLAMGDGLDTYRPLDSPAYEDTIISVPTHTTSYEELRRKNREEFEHKRPKPYSSRNQSEDLTEDRRLDTPSPAAGNVNPSRLNEKNKYGDVWAE